MSGIYKSAEGQRAIHERYSKFLAYWPVPNRHLRLPTRAGETFVIASGRDAVPVLAIVGGGDALLDSAETRRRLEANVATAEIRFLPDMGHAVVGQTAPIGEFLRRVHGA